MKNTVVSEILNVTFAGAIRFKQHIVELMRPATPSYKTSASAVPLFAILSIASSDRPGLFWMSIICMLFFVVLAVSQYGMFSKSKNNSI